MVQCDWNGRDQEKGVLMSRESVAGDGSGVNLEISFLGFDAIAKNHYRFEVIQTTFKSVTTGNNPTGVPYVRVLFLVPGGKTEPQTKHYPLDMWKYGSALQQRPEDRSLYGRGATIKTMHPEPSLKPF
uniref:Retrotransposon protein, putative, Ty3-gypsy sub-class n=2 Tax=Oryza sativa subsp. japonica TaxID=39947 RepID=Q2R7E8_ORYSJ|nr:retrotransposon protein, putative, Ty3-gypsy sub-class [Oryza sativa Japonica Group]ABA92567.1 retrotransposon protein, putative, Ty3-gypsy subclass [Oryza sativa Japonica Group]